MLASFVSGEYLKRGEQDFLLETRLTEGLVDSRFKNILS